MLTKPEMILIDLDGTLVDSVPDLTVAVDRTMDEMGLPRRGEDRVREWVGNGVERLVKRALTDSLDGEPDPALFERALPVFLDHYAEHCNEHSHLYPGVREGLDYLGAAGYRLGCVTNKAARFTEPLLKALGIYDDFDLIISGDTLERTKPDPEPLRYAARYFKVEPQHALMVGDSVSDVRAARAAGFAIVCVSYGYNHGEDIRDSTPDAVIDTLAEVRGLLEEAA